MFRSKSSTFFTGSIIITNFNGKFFFFNEIPECNRIEILKYKKILIIIEKVMSKNTKKQFVIKEQ